jgi:hypothetical protein
MFKGRRGKESCGLKSQTCRRQHLGNIDLRLTFGPADLGAGLGRGSKVCTQHREKGTDCALGPKRFESWLCW